MKEYDLVVLGSGGAGYRVAMSGKDAGWNVALVEDGIFGGTCSVRGCLPKKVLSGTAEVADLNRRLHGLNIIAEPPKMNWSALIAHKRSFTDSVPGDTEKALKDAGVDVYHGSPRFTGNLELEVNGEKISGKKVHIAVGAKPAHLPIEGFEHLIISDDFLEIDHLPGRVLFVGGGYVSFELAHVAARFGAKVTILQNDDKPLPMFDRDIIRTLVSATKEIGIDVVMNSGAQKIEKHGETFTVTSPDGRTFEADLVVHGAGRPPAISDLDLEATGVEYDPRRGVLVNEYLQSISNPDVYAGGDAAASGPPLSPVSRVHGQIVADNLINNKKHKQPSYASTASVIFTTPPVGKVGLTEQEAKETGLDITVRTEDLSAWFDAKRLNLKHTMAKTVIDSDSGKIVGAHLIGNHAEDLTNMFALAIETGLTADQFKAPIYAFPTPSDDARYVL